MALTHSEWKICSLDLIDGVQRELSLKARAKTKAALEKFRKRLRGVRVARQRGPFDRDLNAFLQSES